MAHVTKRGSRYQGAYRTPDGREVTKTWAKAADAKRWAHEGEAAVRRGDWLDATRGRTSFAEWTKEWWDTTATNRPSTRARDASYLRNYLLPAFGSVPLVAIDHTSVRRFVAGLSESGLAPATVSKAYQILSKVMQAAVHDRRIGASPCANVPLPRVERQEMRFLNSAEVARLADAIHPRYRAMVFVGCWAGLRVGELAGLKVSRVDPLRRRIDVAEIVTEVGGTLHWGQPKTRAGRRSITLPAQVMDILVAHMETYSTGEHVFTGPEGGVLRVNAWRRRFWNPAVAAAGLSPLRPHDMRHTAVALWIATGAKPLEVSRRAGHTSSSFTQDRYGHLFPEDEDALAARLDAVVITATPEATVSPIRAVER